MAANAASAEAVRGYRERVETTLALDALLVLPDGVLEGQVEEPDTFPPLPEAAPAESRVLAVRVLDYRADKPRYRQTTRQARMKIALPRHAEGYNRLTFWANLQGGRFGMISTHLEASGVVSPVLADKRQRVFLRRAINGGEWTRIIVDFPHAIASWKQHVQRLSVGCSTMYPGPEERREDFRLLLAGFRYEQIANPRKWYGWEPDPQVLTVNQVGYKPLSRKRVLAAASLEERAFEVREAASDNVVLHGRLEEKHAALGPYVEGDFSLLRRPGRYYLRAGPVSSVAFNVEERPFAPVSRAILSVLKGMRCGSGSPFHEPCHLDAGWDREKECFVDLVGGYHDAADMLRTDHSQVPRMTTWLMKSCRLLPPNDPMRLPMLEEARWCAELLDKHLRRFGRIAMAGLRDGYYLTDNISGTEDDWTVDGRSAHSFYSQSTIGLAALSEALQAEDPAFAERLKEILETTEGRSSGGGPAVGRSIQAYLALLRLTDRAALAEECRVWIDRYTETLLARQENRVVQGSDPAFSGMFAVAGPGKEYWNDLLDAAYGNHVVALTDLMEALPEHPDWHRWYFAVRRYADFYIKSGYQYTAPYVMPVDLLTEDQSEAARAKICGTGEPTMVGELDGRPLFCHQMGKRMTSNSKLTASAMAMYAWTRVAATLADPDAAGFAEELAGTFFGINPFNWIRVTGFGEDPCLTIMGYYPFVPGMVTHYPNTYQFNRYVPLAHINEIWIAGQWEANLAATCLDAPCVVKGRITSGGAPYHGPAVIRGPEGQEWRRFDTRPDGGYGPLKLAGGGVVSLEAASTARRFASVAGARHTIDLDTHTEVTVSLGRLTGRQDREIPTRQGFPALPAGEDLRLRLTLRPLGSRPSTHVLRAYAANAVIEPAEQTVQVAAPDAGNADYTVRALQPGETVCLFVELDGDHTRKFELSAISVAPDP